MKGFLLDTNIPSEMTRPRPQSSVSRWLDDADDDQLYLSVISLGEILKGVTVLPESRRRSQLQQWLDETLRPWFQGRILPVNELIAERWGVLAGQCQLKGKNPQGGGRFACGDRSGIRAYHCHAERERFRWPGRWDLQPLGATSKADESHTAYCKALLFFMSEAMVREAAYRTRARATDRTGITSIAFCRPIARNASVMVAEPADAAA